MRNYEELANAIIVQAVKDYQTARRKLKRNPCSSKAKAEYRELEDFFHSKWFQVLTDVDPNYILDRQKEETV